MSHEILQSLGTSEGVKLWGTEKGEAGHTGESPAVTEDSTACALQK